MVEKLIHDWLPCLYPSDAESQWKTQEVEEAKSGNKVDLCYQVLEKSGHGTFGTVFKVETKANEILAMKQIEHRNRHKCREVLTMKALDHFNVVSLHYFCTEKVYSKYRDIIFMEYLPESLHVHITRIKRAKTTLKPLIVCCFTYQLCRGLAHLHHRGIAHRDVKPRNLLVDSSKNVLKICDLGSAKKLDDSDRNITYICSRWYRAPELLFANKNYTVAIDVWSIGCCLAQMIRLEPLFKGRNTADQIAKIFKMLGSPTEEEIWKLNVLPEQLPERSLPRSPPEEIFIHEFSGATEWFSGCLLGIFVFLLEFRFVFFGV